MEVTKRIVNLRRHTVGYVVGGKEYTRLQTVKLARQGKVDGVKVVNSSVGVHLQGRGQSLYDLPVKLGTSNRFIAKLRA